MAGTIHSAEKQTLPMGIKKNRGISPDAQGRARFDGGKYGKRRIHFTRKSLNFLL